MSTAGFDSSIRRRLFFSHLACAMFICVGFGGYFFVTASNSLVSGIGPEMTQVAALVHTALQEPESASELRARDDSWVQSRLTDLVARSTRIRNLTVELGSAEQGRLLSARAPQGARSRDSYFDFSQGRTPSAFELTKYFTGSESDTRVEGRIALPGSDALEVRVELAIGNVTERMRLMQLSAALALLVALGFAVAVSRIMASRFLSTIRELNRRCQEMAGNEDVQPLEVDTADELQSLLSSFNVLAERLKKASGEREAALLSLTGANQRLEQQVDERASELDKLNTILRDEVEHRLRTEAMIAEAAISDQLTGLLNRRGMLEILERALDCAGKRQQQLSVAVADVDFFKSINDRYGHERGDKVLVQVAAEMTKAMAGEDIVARWGGEEFLLLWVDCPLAEGRQRAEKLRYAISAMSCGEDDVRVTISIGITEGRAGDTLDRLLARADKALFHAKDSGRNLVVSTGEYPVSRQQADSAS